MSWSVMLNFGEGYFRLSQIQKGNEIRRKQAQIRIPYISEKVVAKYIFLRLPVGALHLNWYEHRSLAFAAVRSRTDQPYTWN